MISEGVDVLYPAGNGYNVPMIEEAKRNDIFVIGYISDQHVHGEKTVLTSTVQHVDQLYLEAALKYDKGNLKSGNMKFDIQDGVITLGEFSSLVPYSYQEYIKHYITHYIKTGKLPNAKED